MKLDKWVPRYMQVDSDSCALASLQCVKGFSLRKIEENELKILSRMTDDGTTALGVATAASEKGLQVELGCLKGYKVRLGTIHASINSPNFLEFDSESQAQQWLIGILDKNKSPAILYICQDTKEKIIHAIVVTGIKNGEALYFDPEQDNLQKVEQGLLWNKWSNAGNIAIICT